MRKVCFVGNFDTSSVGEPEIAKSLEELGIEVVQVSEGSTTLEQVRNIIKEEGCDLLLFAKFRVGSLEARRHFIKHLPIPTVCWVYDLYIGL